MKKIYYLPAIILLVKNVNKSRILFITWRMDSYSGWGKYSLDLVNSLREMGVEVTVECISGPLDFKKNFVFSWWYALRLYKKYKNGGFDIVHCAIEPYALITMHLAKKLQLPYFLTLHGSYSVILLRHRLYGYFQIKVYKNAKKLIAVSEYTASRVRELISLDNIVVIPNGFKGHVADNPRKLSVPKVLLGVGALKNRKGYHLVIEALSKIKNSISPFKYYIVGSLDDEDYENRLQNLIQKHALGNEIIITGKLSSQELEAIYEKAHLFILTSISEGDYFEGFGLVYLEANARGIPAVAMRGSGAEEAVIEGKNGLVAKQGDTEDLAFKIRTILNDESAYARLSLGSLDMAHIKGWHATVLSYIELYNRSI